MEDSSFLFGTFCNSEFKLRDSPRTSALKRGTIFVDSENVINNPPLLGSWKRYEIGCKLVLSANRKSIGLSISTKIGDLE